MLKDEQKQLAVNVKIAPATAPGQALGFSLQYTRLTAMLLDAPEGAVCSLEVIDDVARKDALGNTILVQSKSSLTNNPVSNNSSSLWKTLSNWIQLSEQEFVDPSKTLFEIYVSREVSGEIVKSFHDASNLKEAEKALQLAKEKLWGKPSIYRQKETLADAILPYTEKVFTTSRTLILQIIQNFQLNCGSGSPQEDIEKLLRQHPISETKVNDIADKLCGWVKRKVDRQLESKQPAYISRDEFHKEYVAYVRKVDRESILYSFSPKPSENEIRDNLPQVFVQQLDIIDLSFEDKLEAISDYLRASADRVQWSETGDVHEESFIELNEELQKKWRNVCSEKAITNEDISDLRRGKLIYLDCIQHTTHIQGMRPPMHFIPGCYHKLSNKMSIGWHPHYRLMLSENKHAAK